MKRNVDLHSDWLSWLRSSVLTALLLIPVMGNAGTEPQAHRNARCNGCHGSTQASTVAGALTAKPSTEIGSTDRQCRRCHRGFKHTTRRFESTAADRDARCTNCHQFHEPSVLVTGEGDVDLAVLHQDAVQHCQSCHASRQSLQELSEGHRKAARLYHADAASLTDTTPSDACLRCHDRESTSPWRDATTGLGPTFANHRSHPVGVVVEPGSGDDATSIRWNLDARLQLFDGRIECQTCHRLTASSPYQLVPFPSPKDLCLGCHEFKRGARASRANLLATASASE